MQLAVQSSIGPPVPLSSLKKDFLLRNPSRIIIILLQCIRITRPAVTLTYNKNLQQKPSQNQLEALQIMQENFSLEHFLALYSSLILLLPQFY